MITAREARAKVSNYEQENEKRKLILIEKIIMDSIEDGRTYCYYGSDIPQKVYSYLSSLGYEVRDVDEHLYLISW